MLTTIAKRIQSRLSRTGVKVGLGDIKTQCQSIISDIDNPTEIELLAVQEYFTSNATELVVINNGIDTVNTASIHDDITNDDSAISPQTNTLATSTKQELVSTTAISLGIELSTTEIDQIADNFDNSSDDFTQTLEQVKTAIIAYVQHKIAANNQMITDTINEISQVASDGFENNSQTLTNGLKQLNQQLIQQSTDFKSKLAGTLSRFKLPAAS